MKDKNKVFSSSDHLLYNVGSSEIRILAIRGRKDRKSHTRALCVNRKVARIDISISTDAFLRGIPLRYREPQNFIVVSCGLQSSCKSDIAFARLRIKKRFIKLLWIDLVGKLLSLKLSLSLFFSVCHRAVVPQTGELRKRTRKTSPRTLYFLINFQRLEYADKD